MSSGDSASPPTLEAFLLRWSVAVFTLIGLLLAVVLFMLRTPTYESRAVVSVVNPLGTMGDEAALVLSDDVLGTATETLGFKPSIDVEPNEVADLLTITARADDPDDAAQAASRLAEAYVRAQSSVAVTVIDPAEPNDSPVAPNRLVYLVIGSGLGALAGAAFTALQRAQQVVRGRSGPDRRLPPIRPARDSSGEFASQMLAATRVEDPDTFTYDEALDIRITDDMLTPTGHTVIDVRRHTGTEFSEGLTGATETDPDDADIHDDPASAAQPEVTMNNGDHPRSPDEGTASADSLPATSPVDDVVDLRAEALTVIDVTEPSDDDVRGTVTPTSVASGAPSERSTSPGRGSSSAFADRLAQPAAPARARSNDRSASDQLPGSAPRFVSDPAPQRAEADPDPIRVATKAAVADALARARARFDAEIAEINLAHEERLSTVEAANERQLAELRNELAEARRAAAAARARAQRRAGDDQHRVGDLQAQVEALESEISGLRTQLENERIAHLRELTSERDAADQALSEARREYREQLEANEQTGRDALDIHRSELDALLAQQRAEHQADLDRQHRQHEIALAQLRQRRKDDLTKLGERHRVELAALEAQSQQNATRLVDQTKHTVAELRATEKRLIGELDELGQREQRHRNEAQLLRTTLADTERERAEIERTLRDELEETRSALALERERNAALREDVVRRTAEAHQAVDRAIEDRSRQLGELEALVAQQREHAERRIRETNEAAEERARAAARREAELHARIVRLERELDERRPRTG